MLDNTFKKSIRLLGTSMLISIIAIQIYIPTSHIEEFVYIFAFVLEAGFHLAAYADLRLMVILLLLCLSSDRITSVSHHNRLSSLVFSMLAIFTGLRKQSRQL